MPTYTFALNSTAYYGYATVLEVTQTVDQPLSTEFACLKAMLASGAAAHLTDSDGSTALHNAVKNHSHRAIRVLLQHSCVERVGAARHQKIYLMARDARGETVLVRAVVTNDLASVQALTTAGEVMPGMPCDLKPKGCPCRGNAH